MPDQVRLKPGQVRDLLHRLMCMSEFCDGVDHKRRAYGPAVKEVMASDDQAYAIHDHVCPAQVSGGCPDRERHREPFARLIAGYK